MNGLIEHCPRECSAARLETVAELTQISARLSRQVFCSRYGLDETDFEGIKSVLRKLVESHEFEDRTETVDLREAVYKRAPISPNLIQVGSVESEVNTARIGVSVASPELLEVLEVRLRSVELLECLVKIHYAISPLQPAETRQVRIWTKRLCSMSNRTSE